MKHAAGVTPALPHRLEAVPGHGGGVDTVASHEDDRLLVAVSEDGAAVDRDAGDAFALQRLQQLAARTEHSDAFVTVVSDDELVEGRARDALGTTDGSDTHVADELALHTEHTHTVVNTLTRWLPLSVMAT